MPTDTTAGTTTQSPDIYIDIDFKKSLVTLSKEEMDAIANDIARRVFYDVLKDNYGTEFAELVSAELANKKAGD